MDKIRNYFIKLLGGMTRDEFEEKRSSYEKWAFNNLKGKNEEVIPDCYNYSPFYGDNILILKSRVRVMGGAVSGIKVAPWCKEVLLSGLSLISKSKEN